MQNTLGNNKEKKKHKINKGAGLNEWQKIMLPKKNTHNDGISAYTYLMMERYGTVSNKD